MLEKSLENKCIKTAKNVGIESIKLNASSCRGWPDRIFFIGNGILWFVEFKRKNGKTRKNQDNIIYYLKNNSYNIDVIDSYDCFVGKLRQLIMLKREKKCTNIEYLNE